MRIFLTGATGYIGGAVLDALVRAGHQVTGAGARQRESRAGCRPGRPPGGRQPRRAQSYRAAAEAQDGYIHTAFDGSGRGAGDRSRRRSRRSWPPPGGRAPPARSPARRGSSSTPPASGCSAGRPNRPTKTRPSTRSRSCPGGPTHERPGARWRQRAAAHRRGPPGVVYGGGAGHGRRPVQGRPPTAWCASSATATITGRSCTTAISPISTCGSRASDELRRVPRQRRRRRARERHRGGDRAVSAAAGPMCATCRSKRRAPRWALRRRAVARPGRPQPARPRARLGPEPASVAGNAARLLDEWRAARG